MADKHTRITNASAKRISRKKKQKSSHSEFSKKLIWQESALIWIISISFIILAFVCVKNAYFGELPWLTAMVGLPWTAYAVSQAFYYRKAMKENTKDGIKYDTTMEELKQALAQEQYEFEADLKEAGYQPPQEQTTYPLNTEYNDNYDRFG